MKIVRFLKVKRLLPFLLAVSLILLHNSDAGSQPNVSTATPLSEVVATPLVNPDYDLASPKATLRTFTNAMASYAKNPEKEFLEEALKCMDLSEILEFTRDQQGKNLALKLVSILNRSDFDRRKVSNNADGDNFVIRSDEKGQIVLQKVNGEWKFNKVTISNIPALFAAVEGDRAVKDAVPEIEPDRSFLNVREYVPSLLRNKNVYLEDWQWLGIALSILIAMLAAKASFHILKIVIRILVRKLQFLSSNNSIAKFVKPVSYLIFVFILQAQIALLDIEPAFYASLLRILEILKIITLFVIFLRFIDFISEIIKLKPHKFFGGADEVLISFFRTIARTLVFFVGLILLANLFSLNITGLVAGLGIGGLALALAAKDTIENIFGSITVLIDKPFKVGDFIDLSGMKGTVEQIGLRSTRLRTPEHSVLTIPNSKLISVVVDNLGARQFWRTKFLIGIIYETPPEKILSFCEALREHLKKHELARQDYVVDVTELASSGINILVQVYFKVNSFAHDTALKGELYIEVLKIAKQLEIDFAYTTQVVYNK